MKRLLKGRREGLEAEPSVFLTASWRDVVLVNYRVPPELLQPHVPAGSVLDTPDAEPDAHLLSLVALRFRNTRVRGVKIPTAQDFGEVNLRFYVRQDEKRAAVFLREFVPAPLIILGARLVYQQPYFPAQVTHRVTRHDGLITVQTRFRNRRHQGGIDLTAREESTIPLSDSVAHFLKEHYWGFHQGRDGTSFAYQVEHPIWTTYPVERAAVTIDPGALLGGQWRTLDWAAARHSVVFAAGSDVTVYSAIPLVAPAPLAGGDRSPSGQS